MSSLSPFPRGCWAFKQSISWIITSINNWESVFYFVIFTPHHLHSLSALGRIPGKVKCYYCSYKIKPCTYLPAAFPLLFWRKHLFGFPNWSVLSSNSLLNSQTGSKSLQLNRRLFYDTEIVSRDTPSLEFVDILHGNQRNIMMRTGKCSSWPVMCNGDSDSECT